MKWSFILAFLAKQVCVSELSLCYVRCSVSMPTVTLCKVTSVTMCLSNSLLLVIPALLAVSTNIVTVNCQQQAEVNVARNSMFGLPRFPVLSISFDLVRATFNHLPVLSISADTLNVDSAWLFFFACLAGTVFVGVPHPLQIRTCVQQSPWCNFRRCVGFLFL